MQFIHAYGANLVVGRVEQWGHWNYLILAVLVAVEGPVVTLLGAAAAATGILDPVMVFLSASTGNLAADMFWYALGLAGKARWLQKLLGRFGISDLQLARAQNEIREHSFRIVLLAKLTASFAIPVLVAAGMARVAWHKIVRALLPGECVWTGSLVLAGYYFSQSIKHLERGVQIVALMGGITMFVFFTKYVKTLYGAVSTTVATSPLDRSLADHTGTVVSREK